LFTTARPIVKDSGGCCDGVETDGGAGGRTPRAGKVGPRSNPGPYFFERAPRSISEGFRITKAGDRAGERSRLICDTVTHARDTRMPSGTRAA
jgi:hypothetical protein